MLTKVTILTLFLLTSAVLSAGVKHLRKVNPNKRNVVNPPVVDGMKKIDQYLLTSLYTVDRAQSSHKDICDVALTELNRKERQQGRKVTGAALSNWKALPCTKDADQCEVLAASIRSHSMLIMWGSKAAGFAESGGFCAQNAIDKFGYSHSLLEFTYKKTEDWMSYASLAGTVFDEINSKYDDTNNRF